MRALALQLLVDWHPAPSLDSFLHAHRPRPERSAAEARAALEPEIAALLRSEVESIPHLAAQAAGRYRIAAAVPELLAAVEEERGSATARVAALQALRDLQAPELERAASRALADARPAVRSAAVGILVALDVDRALTILERALHDGTSPEKQAALAALGHLAHPRADQLLATAMDRLLADELAGELMLELLTAVTRRAAEVADLKEKQIRYENLSAATDPPPPPPPEPARRRSRARARRLREQPRHLRPLPLPRRDAPRAGRRRAPGHRQPSRSQRSPPGAPRSERPHVGGLPGRSRSRPSTRSSTTA